MADVLPTINNEPPQGIQAMLDTIYLWNPDVANELIEKVNELLEEIGNVSGTIRPYSELTAPVLQYMPCYDGDNVYVAAQDLDELPGTLNPSQWILIATKAPVLQAGTGISIDGNEISVTQAISDGAAAGSTAVQPGDLGTAAYAATTDFATAAQGSLADSAVQPGDLGTAAYASTSDFATSAQGGKADTAVQPGDLGTAAYAATTDFATAAQGAKADTAVQPGDLATVATTGSYNDLMHKPTIPAAQVNSDWTATSGVAEILHKPTLGTAAAEDTTAFATAAQGTKADTAVQPGDLGTAAYAATTDFATSTQGGKADTALQPADIVDNLTSTATNKALSANQGKELEAQIVALEGRGRYLSSWNCATGLAGTNPPTSPYTYTAGDYFIVSTVDTTTNYRPSGTQYVTGTASTTVETEQVAVNDTYTYDGTNWSLLKTSKVDALPPQTGNAGKFLTTNGTDASWSDKPLVNASTLSNSMVIAGTDSSSGGANTILGVFGTASGTAYRGAAFGLSSKVGKAGTVTFNTVAFGADADAQASYGMAIGGDAVVTGEHAIQLGSTGNTTTNSDANTVKIANANGNFEIMSADGTIPEARLADTTSAAQGQALVLDSNLNAIWSTVESLPSQSGQSGKYLTTNGTTASWAAVEALPTQTSHNGEFLTTNGTTASWATVDSLPTQTGHSGEFLTTNGTAASWAAPVAATFRVWGANE